MTTIALRVSSVCFLIYMITVFKNVVVVYDEFLERNARNIT
jgi:hypothetical protein